MSLIKQLLNPFIAFDDDDKKDDKIKKEAVVPPASTGAQPAPSASGEPVHHPLITDSEHAVSSADKTPVYSPSGTLTAPTNEHQQYFDNLIENANRTNPIFSGADYKEFIDSKVDIDDIADEALKYKTALGIFKNSGLTKDKLLSTGQEYINLIGRDMNAFQSAYVQQYQKEIRPKEELIQKKAEELQALTQRLNILKGEINSLTQEINLAKVKLDTNKNSFLLAGENKQQEIQNELKKIMLYF